MSALTNSIRSILPPGSLLAHWSQADLSQGDGTEITSWIDAENGIVATPTNDNPIYRANYDAKGFPAVDFALDGAASRGLLADDPALANKNVTAIIVLYEATGIGVTNASTPFAYGNTTTNLMRLRTATARGTYAFQYQNEQASIGNTANDDPDEISIIVVNFAQTPTTGNNRHMLIGQRGAAGLDAESVNTAPLTTQRLWIGKRPADTIQGYPGAIYEMIALDNDVCGLHGAIAAQVLVAEAYTLPVFDPIPTPSTPDYPSVNDVRAGTEFDSGNLTGTVVIPQTKDVRDGIQYDAPATQQTGALALPADTDVRLSVGYGNAGTEFTGRVNVPAAGNVRLGVATDVSATGTVNVPVVNNVRLNVAVDVSGIGTMVIPADTDVRLGTGFDVSSTGLLDLPQESDVRAGTAFDSLTKLGVLDLPGVGDVRLGVSFDDLTKTGRVELPAESNVRQGVEYDDTAAPRTGTLDPGGAADYPAVTDVRLGVEFDGGNLTGTCVVPVAGDVRLGVAVDVAATGTVAVPAANDVRLGVAVDVAGTGTVNVPTVANVRLGTATDVSGVGTLDLPSEGDVRLSVSYDATTKTGRVTIPVESDVRLGTEYDDTAAPRTGTLDPGAGEADYPNVGDVRLGVEYAQGGLTGRVELPTESDVRRGVQYDDTAAPRFGTLDVSASITGDELSTRRIVRGDDVVLVWSDPGTWTDLTGATVKLGLYGDRGNVEYDGTVTAEGDVEVRISSAETSTLQDQYRYDVQATKSGKVETLDGAQGSLLVLPTYTDRPDRIPTTRAWV